MHITCVEPGASRRSRWQAALTIVVWTLVLVGCGSDSPPTSTAAESPASGIEEDIQLACTNLPFPADRLLVLGAENEPGPAAGALRAVLATRAGFVEGVPFPKSGWTRVVDTPDEVQFVALERRQMADHPWYLIAVALRNGRWNSNHIGECRLHPAALEKGFGAGEWWLSTSAKPTDRTLSALVREGACMVGPALPVRIGTPIVAARADEVKVVVPVRETDDNGCLGATPTTIDLGQPLGNRRLVDGAVFPARDVQAQPP